MFRSNTSLGNNDCSILMHRFDNFAASLLLFINSYYIFSDRKDTKIAVKKPYEKNISAPIMIITILLFKRYYKRKKSISVL